ncbi:uncharacterized protein LAJ45_01122 [Morchella importuna]|uniref:uncharacterized protein n=1 Tax=Morchella importuna TaxID=1174673 RepID=UPI001E8E8A67|nr:uncharacterized protein LAJ45_01122 [Morchella importuna]KAH8154594.1 hypothetical protein LAJ45_01122 [Morchella importuna]
MSPSSKIRNIEKKIMALKARHKDYEGRFEALNASTAGREKSASNREKAVGLKEKMKSVKYEILGCEYEIKTVREGVGVEFWVGCVAVRRGERRRRIWRIGWGISGVELKVRW